MSDCIVVECCFFYHLRLNPYRECRFIERESSALTRKAFPQATETTDILADNNFNHTSLWRSCRTINALKRVFKSTRLLSRLFSSRVIIAIPHFLRKQPTGKASNSSNDYLHRNLLSGPPKISERDSERNPKSPNDGNSRGPFP